MRCLKPSTRQKKNILEAITLTKNLPMKLEKTLEKSQQIIKDVQDIPNKVNESVRETKQTIDETVEKTQQTVGETIEKTQQLLKEIKDIPSKVNNSMRETQETVEETVEKTQQAIEDVKGIPKKVKQSVQDTKLDISRKQESVREAMSSVKAFFGLQRPSLRSRWYRTIPMTPKEEALDLAGKATSATVKVALWTGRGVGTLAWNGVRSVYNNTVGPTVEGAWNEQMDNINSSFNTTATVVTTMPSKITSAVATKTRSVPTSISSVTGTKNMPAFLKMKGMVVGKNKRKTRNIDKSEEEIAKAVANIIYKTPAELKKELTDAQNLANEISDALDVAEQALKMNPNGELDDPMIDIEKPQPLGRIETPTPLSRVEKDNQTKTYSNEVLARFQTAKTQDDLDAELEEARSLAKEVSDALEIAEKALTLATTTNNSSESKVDDSP
mmetsp:Transcript_3812/g.8255  ORF Transcript_3812/g.8255 Transcript_3812/m.8255 type:complete len:442 (+) Transcript_3812:674-1999(+)